MSVAIRMAHSGGRLPEARGAPWGSPHFVTAPNPATHLFFWKFLLIKIRDNGRSRFLNLLGGVLMLQQQQQQQGIQQQQQQQQQEVSCPKSRSRSTWRSS